MEHAHDRILIFNTIPTQNSPAADVILGQPDEFSSIVSSLTDLFHPLLRQSAADITAAAHLSSLDYLGDVPWDAHEPAKEWYARIKSRPSFRQILSDHVPGVAPPKHYPDLDF